MSNHPPPLNHAATSSKRVPTLLLLLFLHTAAAQNDAAAAGQPDLPPLYPYGQKFNPLMAIIMVVLVSGFFLMGFVAVYVRQCAEGRSRGRPPVQLEGTFLSGRGSLRGAGHGIDASVIESFPTFQYSSVKGLKIGKGSLECAVCLNEFEDDDVLRLLPRCNHAFHPECIDAWLSSHDTCPVCRANLVPEPGEEFDPPILVAAELEPGLQASGLSNQVSICVDDGHNINSESQSSQADGCLSTNKSRPPRSRSTGMRFTRLFPFPRSHSTGHSLVQLREDRERFTLRLPEDVRDRIMKAASLNRTKNCAVALPRARSERTGYRRGGSSGGGRSMRGRNHFNYERFDQEDRTGRWGFSMNPPFIGRTGSVRSVGNDDVGMTAFKSMSRSEKLPPFDELFIGLDGDDAERSADGLRPPHG